MTREEPPPPPRPDLSSRPRLVPATTAASAQALIVLSTANRTDDRVLTHATAPKVTVIPRKAYGGAYCVMASKPIRTDINFAYPTAEIAVMGPEGAVNIVYRRELQTAKDTQKVRLEKVEEVRDRFANPYIAAERGYIDAVIMPRETRPKLIAALRMLSNKRDTNPPKKHGNIPL